MIKPFKIPKHLHHRPGKQIRMILCPCEYRVGNDRSIVPGKVFTIICTPASRKDRRNGNNGVWIQGQEKPIFVWFFEYEPYIPPIEIQRTKKSFILKRTPKLKRTK